MKFFSLDDIDFHWNELPNHPWVLNNEEKINNYKSLALKFISDDSSYDLIGPNFKSFYLSELPVSILPKFLKIMLYQNGAYHGYGAYTRSIVKEKLLFADEDNVTLRYICVNCPYIIDCIYSDSSLHEKDVINEAISFVIIFSYFESSLYIFDPNKHPFLLPSIIYDDLSNGDFFYDIDIFSLYKSYFNDINKLLNGYLRKNSIKLSSLPPISDIVNKDIKLFFEDRNKKSYQDFYNQLYSINNNNHYFLKILIISLVVLLAVIIHKSSYGPPKFLHVFNDFSNQSYDINIDNSVANDSLSRQVKDNRRKIDFHGNSSRITPSQIVKAPRPILWNSNDGLSVISKDEIKHNNITDDTTKSSHEIVKAPRPIIWSSNDVSVISKDEIKHNNITNDATEVSYESVKGSNPIIWTSNDVSVISKDEIKHNNITDDATEGLYESAKAPRPIIWGSNYVSVISKDEINHNNITDDATKGSYEIVKAPRPIIWGSNDVSVFSKGEIQHNVIDDTTESSYESVKSPRPILWGNDDIAVFSNGEIKHNINDHLIKTLNQTSSPFLVASQSTNHKDVLKPTVWNLNDPFQEYRSYVSTSFFEKDYNGLVNYNSRKYDLGIIDRNNEFYLLNIKSDYELPRKKASHNINRNQEKSKNTSLSKSRRNNKNRRK